MFGYHSILVPHTQCRFPQAKLTKLSAQNVTVKLGTDQYILMTYRYVPTMYKYILQQVTLTLHLHWQSGTITLATLTSVLPTLVRCVVGSFVLMESLHNCQATQARLATPKLAPVFQSMLVQLSSDGVNRFC